MSELRRKKWCLVTLNYFIVVLESQKVQQYTVLHKIVPYINYNKIIIDIKQGQYILKVVRELVYYWLGSKFKRQTAARDLHNLHIFLQTHE